MISKLSNCTLKKYTKMAEEKTMNNVTNFCIQLTTSRFDKLSEL